MRYLRWLNTSYGEPLTAVRPPATGSIAKAATLPAVPSVGLAANTNMPLQSTVTLAMFAFVTVPVPEVPLTMQFCVGFVG